MLTDTSAIRSYFAKLGLDHEIADLYLTLHSHGPQTISELSRNSGVERTRIYRLIDSLMESRLIEVETHYKRGIIKPAPIANLHILIAEKEQELRSLQDELGLIEQVLARNSLSSAATSVQFYQGAEGVKQMTWNQLKAKEGSENLSILHENTQINTGLSFFTRWVARFNEKQMRSRSIIDDNFLESQRKWRTKHNTEKLQHWQARYVTPDVFAITHNMVINDDTVSYFNWKNGEVFGIEIHNAEIAQTQRAFFELLWQKATPHDGGITSHKQA